MSLQRLYGRIPKVYGKGEYAQQVWNLTKRMARDDSLPNAPVDKVGFDQLIILDRSIDLMSVLATQLTYEGLIGKFLIIFEIFSTCFWVLIYPITY